jgi:4-hydroxy-tetrahydrodipicolinate synthase
MFRGTYTALITPFKNDEIDEDAFRRLIDTQIAGGVTGIVPVGTTGESPTLDHTEHLRVIELAVQFAAGRCQVIAGTGSNSTTEAVAMTCDAKAAGADGALLVAPYYNKPSQEGLYRHFKAIADASDLPLVLYSIPGRCGIAIAIETVARLAADCPTIVGIKEAGGDADRVSALDAALPETFDILSGDDSLTLPFMAVGAHGVISVASNLVPGPVSQMVRKIAAGDFAAGLALHRQLYPLFKDLLSLGTNPVPIKTALALTGAVTPELRLPLCPMDDTNTAKLQATLDQLDLLPS